MFDVSHFPRGYLVEALYGGQALLSCLPTPIPLTILGSLDDFVVGGQHILVCRNQPLVDRLQVLRRPDLAQPFEASTGLIRGYLATEDVSLDGYRLTVPSILSAP